MYALPTYQLNKLQLIQNTATHVVCFARKYNHITPVLPSLYWLPVRLIFKILLLVDKALNGMAPFYLSDMLRYRMSTRTLRSTSRNFPACSESNLQQVAWWSRAFNCRPETVEPASIEYKTIQYRGHFYEGAKNSFI